MQRLSQDSGQKVPHHRPAERGCAGDRETPELNQQDGTMTARALDGDAF